MNQLLTEDRLEQENLEYAGTPGVSRENRKSGFTPAFRDMETGRIELSCFLNGQPAPVHLIEGLPDCWVVERDELSRATALLKSVIAGFVREGCFYTRSEAVNAMMEESRQGSFIANEPACI